MGERHLTLLALLEEAVALEQAGGTWTQKHAAAVTGYSVSFLRNSDCPKAYEEGHGPKGKRRVVYRPADVRAWKAARLRDREGRPLVASLEQAG